MPDDLLELLERRARGSSESLNALAVRLLDEGLRIEDHPLIHFRTGGSGLRRPALLGTRLDVGQVMSSLRAGEMYVAATADYLGLSEAQVRAAVAYYAEYPAEVDDHLAEEEAFAARERERWERTQRVLTA